ncbi:hypothetical protein B0H10DRAFT_2215212 [Mycena sp. CBHHK59/15]|nr:hypothetical protein B0H10DRAFT_2215212 [Mycena sp. CBHHK59/15]
MRFNAPIRDAAFVVRTLFLVFPTTRNPMVPLLSVFPKSHRDRWRDVAYTVLTSYPRRPTCLRTTAASVRRALDFLSPQSTAGPAWGDVDRGRSVLTARAPHSASMASVSRMQLALSSFGPSSSALGGGEMNGYMEQWMAQVSGSRKGKGKEREDMDIDVDGDADTGMSVRPQPHSRLQSQQHSPLHVVSPPPLPHSSPPLSFAPPPLPPHLPQQSRRLSWALQFHIALLFGE